MHVLSDQLPTWRLSKAGRQGADWLGVVGGIVILAIVGGFLLVVLSHISPPNNSGNTAPADDDQFMPARGRHH